MRVPLSIRALAVPVVVLVGVAATGSAASSAYTVRKGDTLSRLARRFNVPVGVLAQANGIGNIHLIRDGQRITVPSPTGKTGTGVPASPVVEATGGGFHVVNAGESLATIARRYKTTVDALAKANGLDNPNRIRIGSRLSVPGGAGWVCPVKADPRTVVNNWGAPRPGHRLHMGNDIFARRGAPVVAPVSGSITHASGSIAGLAFYLVGDDGNTYYGAHMDTYTRGAGRVTAGETIGTVGNTGNARTTPPHLHFEIRPNGGGAVNPWYTLRRWC